MHMVETALQVQSCINDPMLDDVLVYKFCYDLHPVIVRTICEYN